MEFNIRPMRLEDLPRVRELEELSFSLPWPERSFRYELTENKAARCWVMDTTDPVGNASLVAMLVLWKIVDEAHIGTIAVHPGFRRQGLGGGLLTHVLLAAAHEGIRSAYLEVRRSNLAAIQLYSKFGFEVAGVRKNYYQDNGEDALLLTLENLDLELL